MSKYLDTSFASDDSQQPMKAGSARWFLDDATEKLNSTTGAIVGQLSNLSALPALGNGILTTTPYVLTGCVPENTGVGSYIMLGSIYYQGDVYLVNQTTAGSIPSPMYATYSLISTSLDPTKFSDFTFHNIHIEKYITFTNDGTGALFQYTDMHFMRPVPLQINDAVTILNNASTPSDWKLINAASGWTSSAYQNQDSYGNVHIRGSFVYLGSGASASGIIFSEINSDIAHVMPAYFYTQPYLYENGAGGDGFGTAYIQLHTNGSFELTALGAPWNMTSGKTNIGNGTVIQVDNITFYKN